MSSVNDLATAAVATSSDATASSAASNAPQARGALIVLEGLDRSGKSTQVKLLEQRFLELGRNVKVMRFPDRTTPIGKMIDGYLKSSVEMDDRAIHLLFSANRWEVASTMNSLLASGTSIICDRYYYSGIVYSAAKQTPGLTLHWARAPEVGLPRPDIVLFLDLTEDQARKRGGWGTEIYEKAEMQRRVRELFWGLSMGTLGTGDGPHLAQEHSKLASSVGAGSVDVKPFRQEEEDIVLVDASPSVEEVAEEIWGKVRSRVEAVNRGEVGWVVRTVS